jgi:hypothetical protein
MKQPKRESKLIPVDGAMLDYVTASLCNNPASKFEVSSVSLISNPLQTLRFMQYCRSLSPENQVFESHYHYANPHALRCIAQGGFNTTFCGDGWYGYGVYFSPVPEYALAQYGYLVSTVRDAANGATLYEFSIRVQEKTATGRKPMLMQFDADGNAEVAKNVKLSDRTVLTLDPHDNARILLDGLLIKKHMQSCTLETSFVAMVCLVPVGGKRCVVTRKQMENKLCHKSSSCGGPSGKPEENIPAHTVHWSPQGSECCVPMQHGLLGSSDVSTEFQILPRYLVRFTGTPAHVPKERE